LKIRIFKDDQPITSRDLLSTHARLQPYFAKGPRQVAAIWLLRKTSLDLPVNFFIDCHHRYGGSLWMIKQPYYWLKPKAFKVYFTLSWPIRHLYYIDWPTVTKVAWGRAAYAITLPFHLIRPHAFKFYFAGSRPIRKAFYFAKFQFEKRILRVKK
jgi:hypothetical protein